MYHNTARPAWSERTEAHLACFRPYPIPYHSEKDNARGGGSKIIPLTQVQALERAEAYLDADDVEKYFSDMIEDA